MLTLSAPAVLASRPFLEWMRASGIDPLRAGPPDAARYAATLLAAVSPSASASVSASASAVGGGGGLPGALITTATARMYAHVAQHFAALEGHDREEVLSALRLGRGLHTWLAAPPPAWAAELVRRAVEDGVERRVVPLLVNARLAAQARPPRGTLVHDDAHRIAVAAGPERGSPQFPARLLVRARHLWRLADATRPDTRSLFMILLEGGMASEDAVIAAVRLVGGDRA